MATNHVWIVEMWCETHKRWEPTVSTSLNRAAARRELKRWESGSPDDKFTVTRYESRD